MPECIHSSLPSHSLSPSAFARLNGCLMSTRVCAAANPKQGSAAQPKMANESQREWKAEGERCSEWVRADSANMQSRWQTLLSRKCAAKEEKIIPAQAAQVLSSTHTHSHTETHLHAPDNDSHTPTHVRLHLHTHTHALLDPSYLRKTKWSI